MPPELTIQQLYDQILRLTGRVERKQFGAPSPTPRQGQLLSSFLNDLQRNDHWAKVPPRESLEGRLLLFNSALTALGIKTVRPPFYKAFLQDVDFTSHDSLHVAVQRFCCLAMLEFGSFRYAYKLLRVEDEETLQNLFDRYFPKAERIRLAEAQFLYRLPVSGLTPVPADRLFLLGYLASAQREEVNKAIGRMREILEQIQAEFLKRHDLRLILKEKKLLDEWTHLEAKTGKMSRLSELIAGPIFGAYRPAQVFKEVMETLVSYDPAILKEVKEQGNHNTEVYLASAHLDIYIATSMRDITHFTSMAQFVASLMQSPDLKEMRIRYFDPTQSFMEDRIQKGLLECLMIKRAKMTIYNAQEGDTFGKDSEAAITLAQGKPVLVYVARFFQEQLAEQYRILDEGREADEVSLVRHLRAKGVLEEEQMQALLTSPSYSKKDILKAWASRSIKSRLQALDYHQLAVECNQHGYLLPEKQDKALEYVLERIINHEARALQFLESHPLALQTALHSGVATGVMVTRDIRTTAQLTKRLLLGAMEYQIDYSKEKDNIILREQLTNSPVRIITSNEVLTTAFWDSYLATPERHL